MLFGRKTAESNDLKPFVLKLKDGFLVGLAQDPETGSPCVGCVQGWLSDRQVYNEKTTEIGLPPRAKEMLAKLNQEQDPHIFYEFMATGTPTRLECLVFPHPRCSCQKTNYVAPKKITHKTNLAFSPIFQIKCVRYGTPGGNLWHFSATGQSPLSQRLHTGFGSHSDKETARLNSIDAWMKKAGLSDLSDRIKTANGVPSQEFLTGKLGLMREKEFDESTFKGVGIGASKEEATLDSLFSFAKLKTLNNYTNSSKNPMLVVGANSWLRHKVPFFLLQQYDLYLLFYPNQSPAWVCGLAAFSRNDTQEAPIFVFGANANISMALEECIHKTLEHCRPNDWRRAENTQLTKSKEGSKNSRLVMWWTNWIYRCPKISLKDVLQLEPHPRDLGEWREYLQSNNQKVTALHLNYPYLPDKIRHIIKLQVPTLSIRERASNVRGIATWSNFQEPVTQL